MKSSSSTLTGLLIAIVMLAFTAGVGQRPRESERGKGETRTRRAEGQSRAE